LIKWFFRRLQDEENVDSLINKKKVKGERNQRGFGFRKMRLRSFMGEK
jgi:hypothetical protein